MKERNKNMSDHILAMTTPVFCRVGAEHLNGIRENLLELHTDNEVNKRFCFIYLYETNDYEIKNHDENIIYIDAKNKSDTEILNRIDYEIKIRQEMNKNEILDLFAELKKRDGKYAFIHQQRNPTWDRFRLLFKSACNHEKDFWHTASYQNIVRKLKEAYVSKKNDRSAEHRLGEENALIDYVRGNSIVHYSSTCTRATLQRR